MITGKSPLLYYILLLYIAVTWQTGPLRAEQVGQSHGLQLLLQTETVFHPEARDVGGDGGFLHFIQPVGQLLQVQTFLHLHHTTGEIQSSITGFPGSEFCSFRPTKTFICPDLSAPTQKCPPRLKLNSSFQQSTLRFKFPSFLETLMISSN